jgi:hypothetical protein
VALRHAGLAALFVVLGVGLQSCLFVKEPEKKPEAVEHVETSPLPLLDMGDELVRSTAGDMIALLPKGWLFLDVSASTSDDVIVVAVDPEYKLSAVFSAVPPAASSKETLEKEGLLGLARVAFGMHQRKSGGAVQLVDSYAIDTLGVRRFGTYSFSTAGGKRTRCAVYTSTLANHYEFALVPLTGSGRELPSDQVQMQAFRSILATIQY